MGPSAALVAFWLSFASAVSGMPIPYEAALPSVTVASRYQGYPLGGAAARGMTDMETGQIAVYLGWTATSNFGRCLLAHELTHWLQVVNRRRYVHASDIEPEAYLVTAECFRALGDRDNERWARGEAVRYARR